ncbi:hypothetical protein CesoFtcFv8_015723 [Champsocephalus esox]|uniref:Rab proteins geranylgeranyltransferase component A n=1 Tax=Champsocephalus esox TaxID=159716 RepID=A0AAN8BLZ2_9TELE|nr:hypothetical protein CesoFtcFv8_015723 [Champsocephalus esox]
MATEELPSEFDVVILGTGLAESVAAAAFSRVGQKVLHLDRRSYYAANWASFSFNALLTWVQQQQEEPQPHEIQDWSSLLEEGEELIYLSQSDSASIRNVQVFCFASEEDEEEAPDTTEEEDSADPQGEAEEEASHQEGEEPEPPLPLPPPAQSQSEPPLTLPPPAQSQSEPPQTLPPPAQSQSEPPQTLPPPGQSNQSLLRPSLLLLRANQSLLRPSLLLLRANQSLLRPSLLLLRANQSLLRPSLLLLRANQSHPTDPPSSCSEPIRAEQKEDQLRSPGEGGAALQHRPGLQADVFSRLIGRSAHQIKRQSLCRVQERHQDTDLSAGDGGAVPCSRSDVFASRQLSVVEKRKLMRFLTSCAEETEEQRAYNGRPYLEFLSDQKLGDNLQHFLLHSIAMVTEATPTEQGLAATRHFLRCLGRYGNTPFLFPVYGLGEIPQCFCREKMCAVFGGIYCLRHSVSCLLLDTHSNRCKAVIDSRGQRISCSHVVLEEGFVGAERKRSSTPPRFLSRAVLITDGSILPTDSEQQVTFTLQPGVLHPAARCPSPCSQVSFTLQPGVLHPAARCPSPCSQVSFTLQSGVLHPAARCPSPCSQVSFTLQPGLLGTVPPAAGGPAVKMVELSPSTMTCSAGTCERDIQYI